MPPDKSSSFAPDMGCFVLRLPVARIVILSWIVSEYDGLGYVKTENASGECIAGETLGSDSEGRNGYVSLFFPEGKRDDVLELLGALRKEGMPLDVLHEKRADHTAEDTEREWTLEDFDTI